MTRIIHETATIGPGVSLGFDVILMAGVELGDSVRIGHHTIVYPGTRIGAGTVIGDHCVIGCQAITSRAGSLHPETLPPLQIGIACVIGASCILVAGSRIGSQVTLCDLVSIQESCEVSDHAVIGPRVLLESASVIGAAAEVQGGCHITSNTVIEERALLGPHVITVNNNRMTRNGGKLSGPRIRAGARIGANTTILGGITVGDEAVVGAGAVVLQDVSNRMVAVGVPARIVRDLAAEVTDLPGLPIAVRRD
jgi:acetyltransferase-like isoleucine patch superfamily enzyme